MRHNKAQMASKGQWAQYPRFRLISDPTLLGYNNSNTIPTVPITIQYPNAIPIHSVLVRSVLNFRTQCSDSNPNAIQFQNIQVSQATILYYDSAQLKALDLTLAQAYSLLAWVDTMSFSYNTVLLKYKPQNKHVQLGYKHK